MAAAYREDEVGPTPQNLPDNELVVYLSANTEGPVPDVTTDGLRSAQQALDGMAASLGTHDVVPLERAIDPNAQDRPPIRGSGAPGHEPASILAVTRFAHGMGVEFVQGLYVATPERE